MKRYLSKAISIIVVFSTILSAMVFMTPVAYADTSDLPDFVDNTDSPYFPAIESQGSLGACVYWSETILPVYIYNEQGYGG